MIEPLLIIVIGILLAPWILKLLFSYFMWVLDIEIDFYWMTIEEKEEGKKLKEIYDKKK